MYEDRRLWRVGPFSRKLVPVHEIALSDETKCRKMRKIRWSFGAVTNSRGLTGTQTTAGLDVN